MATKVKLQNDIKKLKAAIKSKETPKSIISKLQVQLEKAEKELEAISKSGKSDKKTSSSLSLNAKKRIEEAKKERKAQRISAKDSDVEKDGSRRAIKKTGRRISQGLRANQTGSKEDNKGNVYYEYRNNRYDKRPNSAPRLERGGMMGSGGQVNYYIIQRDNGEEFVKYDKSVDKYKLTSKPILARVFSSMNEAEKVIDRYDLNEKLEAKLMVAKVTKNHPYGLLEFLEEDEMASGGMMAKGGEKIPYIIWVSKDGQKRELHGNYKSKRAADMAMNKLWDKGEYKSMGNKPMSMYEKEGLFASGGMMGHELKEDDFVWNEDGKKLVVDKVTNDKYYLSGYKKQSTAYSKTKVNEYLKTGHWSLKPRLERGGMMAKGGKITDISWWENAPKSVVEQTVDYYSNKKKLWNNKEINLSKKEIDELVKVQEIVNKIYPEYNKKFHSKLASGGMMDDSWDYANDKHKLYFSTFGEVMSAINDIAEDNGYEIVDIFPDLSYGGVSYGQTRKAQVELKWNGKEKKGKSKQREKNTLNVQIYRMDSGSYELNSYFSYALGGMMEHGGMMSEGEPHRAEYDGYMAKGGAVEHGLKKGDLIVDDMFWENSVVVKNDKDKTTAKVNLSNGKRVESKM
jgi:hypothetical protein